MITRARAGRLALTCASALATVGLLGACGNPAGPDAVEAPSPAVTLVGADVELPYTLEVPAEDGCPAFTLSAPQEAIAQSGASRAMVRLDEGGTVLVTCWGAGAQRLTIEEIAAPWPAGQDHPAGTRSGPVATRSAYGDALQVETVFTSNGVTLTEWFTERDGYVYAVGYLRPSDDVDRTGTVEAMLAAWSWH